MTSPWCPELYGSLGINLSDCLGLPTSKAGTTNNTAPQAENSLRVIEVDIRIDQVLMEHCVLKDSKASLSSCAMDIMWRQSVMCCMALTSTFRLGTLE